MSMTSYKVSMRWKKMHFAKRLAILDPKKDLQKIEPKY